MTAVEMTPKDVELEEEANATAARRFVSARGPYELYHAPPLARPSMPEDLDADQVEEMVGYFDYSELVDDVHAEEEVRASVADMIRAISPGNIVTPLFDQGGENGMSLIHAWFGPHFPLFRHSHPRLGDCLYYVVAGSAVLGSQVLKPGDGFFVPNGMPYKYRAGPEGVEILEFRAGGGIDGAPLVLLHEPSVDGINRIVDAATQLHDQWQQPPARVAETGRHP
jgi:hypothetical protein